MNRAERMRRRNVVLRAELAQIRRDMVALEADMPVLQERMRLEGERAWQQRAREMRRA